MRHRDALVPLIEERTRALTSAELVERGKTHAVPMSLIHSIAEVVEDPQVLAAGMVAPAPSAELPDYRDVSLPVRMDGTRPRAEGFPPRAGADSRALLLELGLSETEVDELLGEGVVDGPPPPAEP